MLPSTEARPRCAALLCAALLAAQATLPAVAQLNNSDPSATAAVPPADPAEAEKAEAGKAEAGKGAAGKGAAEKGAAETEAAGNPDAPPSATEVAADTSASAADARFANTRDAAVAAMLERLGLAGRVTPLALAEDTSVALLMTPAADTKARGGLLIVPAPRASLADPLTLTLARTVAAGGWFAVVVQPREEAAPPAGAEGRPADTATSVEASAAASAAADSGAADASASTLCAQLTAASTVLVERGATDIVMVAVGAHVARSLACVASLAQPIVGLAALGRWPGTLDTLEVPVLDLPPAHDRLALRFAAARVEAATDKPPATYRQVPIEVADERYEGGELDVSKRLRGWVATLPAKPST